MNIKNYLRKKFIDNPPSVIDYLVIWITALVVIISMPVKSVEFKKWYEHDYVNHYCKGKVEFVLPDRTRVDCLTDEYAIEYDYSYKWAESIGQSLYYSSATGKKAGIVLIIEKKHNNRYLTRLNDAIDMIPCNENTCPAIKVWVVDKRVN